MTKYSFFQNADSASDKNSVKFVKSPITYGDGLVFPGRSVLHSDDGDPIAIVNSNAKHPESSGDTIRQLRAWLVDKGCKTLYGGAMQNHRFLWSAGLRDEADGNGLFYLLTTGVDGTRALQFRAVMVSENPVWALPVPVSPGSYTERVTNHRGFSLDDLDVGFGYVLASWKKMRDAMQRMSRQTMTQAEVYDYLTWYVSRDKKTKREAALDEFFANVLYDAVCELKQGDSITALDMMQGVMSKLTSGARGRPDIRDPQVHFIDNTCGRDATARAALYDDIVHKLDRGEWG